MKKRVGIVVLTVVMAVVLMLVFVACAKNDGGIKEYKISDSEYVVEGTFNKADVAVVCIMNDGTEKSVSTRNLVWNEEDLAKLELDEDNVLTKAGDFKVNVWIIEENALYPEFYIGEWNITVKPLKK